MGQDIRTEECLTLTVPAAARKLGIARGTGYDMARRGIIPTLRFGKKLVVPVRAIERMLDVEAKSQHESSTG